MRSQRSHRELTLTPSEQAALTPRTTTSSEQAAISDFGQRQQAESARKREAEMRVQQRVEALTPRMATAAIENARAQPPSVNTVPIDISEAAADTTPVVVPEKLGHREQADAAADTATETAAKAVIQSGARVAGLGEMCERVALEKRVLGTGAFSVVYRGRISGLGQVAVKRLERQAGDDASAGDFEREVAIMQIPEHPNLLRMLGCANSRTARYLVYPLISGGDLLSYLGSTRHCHRDGRKGGDPIRSTRGRSWRDVRESCSGEARPRNRRL